MSEDRSAPVAVKAGDPIFLSVKAGMTVIVRHLPEVGLTSDDDRWWMADVIYVEGGARNPERYRPSFKSPMSTQARSFG
jgi:hypothetical protein